MRITLLQLPSLLFPQEFSLEIQTLRSEGIPNYKMVINTPDNIEKEYLLISDGKNGNPNIEYVIK
jgi:hypothetical protein